jgi:hypothetical protein
MKKFYSNAFSIILTSLFLTGCTQVNQSTEIDSDYNPEARLKELNITLPSAPQPVANYVNGVRAGNLIFFSWKRAKICRWD